MTGVRIALDYTSALAQTAGVGRYTRSLADGLASVLTPEDRLLLWYAGRGIDAPSSPIITAHDQIDVHALPFTPRMLTTAWQRLRAPVSLERFIGSVDVAHAPDFVAPPSQAPIITTIHDLSYLIVPDMAHPRLRGYLTAAVPRTLERSAHVIAVSETTRRDVIERYGVPSEQVAAIPNGVDRWFAPPGEDAVAKALTRFGLHQPYFITVGTIEPRKNHFALMTAFQELNARYPDATLAIVGRPGWLSEPIVAEIKAATQRLPIRYLRYVDDEWLPALYAGSQALVYPSWYEGFGLPVLEAMASGAPAIVSSGGALPEVVGDTALIVNPHDPSTIAAAMQRLLDDSTLRADLIERGQRHARQYTWSNTAQAHLDLYRAIGSKP